MTQEGICRVVHDESAPDISPEDLPSGLTRDLPVPATVEEARGNQMSLVVLFVLKASIVAREFGQRAGIVFFNTFSSCTSVTSISFLTAIACFLQWELWNYEMEQAFVQATLPQDTYSLGRRVVVRFLVGL